MSWQEYFLKRCPLALPLVTAFRERRGRFHPMNENRKDVFKQKCPKRRLIMYFISKNKPFPLSMGNFKHRVLFFLGQ